MPIASRPRNSGSDLAIAIEWASTLGAAGLWAATGVHRTHSNAGLVLVASSAASLYAGLALIVLAFAARRVRTGRFLPRAPFNLPLLLFLLSALLGWWIAYDRELGLLKLHLLISAFAVYALLAAAGPTAARRFITGFLVLSAAIALYYATQHDYTAEPAKIAFVTQIGLFLNARVPNLSHLLTQPHPNVIAAVLALAMPLNLALVRNEAPDARAWASASHLALSLLTLACIAFGLLMTTSRGAWLALAGAAALWLVHRAASRLGRRLFGGAPPPARWFGFGMTALALLAGLALYAIALTRTDWLGAVPGPATALGRAALYQNTIVLARDYMFTGAGLGAFPMVYSTYSLLIHVMFTPHAHNWYLQLWLEQGLLGIIALAWMIAAAAWLAFRSHGPARHDRPNHAARSWYVSAAGWALVVMLLHGLTDSALYGTRPTALLFVPLGLMLAGSDSPDAASARRAASRRLTRLALVGLPVLILCAGLVWRDIVLSTAFSNLGALAQTRTELALYSWPRWSVQDEVRRHVDLSRPVAAFEQSLAYHAGNQTAHRRLGMIALSTGDYPAALEHLQIAHDLDPAGVTTRRLLGEAYVAAGQLEPAIPLWSTVSNDLGQLAIRAYWYRSIGDDQRAAWVDQVAARSAQ